MEKEILGLKIEEIGLAEIVQVREIEQSFDFQTIDLMAKSFLLKALSERKKEIAEQKVKDMLPMDMEEFLVTLSVTDLSMEDKKYYYNAIDEKKVNDSHKQSFGSAVVSIDFRADDIA
jgi:hypothetical protein